MFILLGIGIFVACQTINKALHDRAKEQLLGFGANIIVQPEGQPFDLYSGTTRGNALLPEHYVDSIRSMEHADMLSAVSPKLYESFSVGDRNLLVVGVTADERKAKPWWLIDTNVLTTEFPFGKEVLLGHYAAANLGDDVTEIELGSEIFLVSGVLDETGSPDDFIKNFIWVFYPCITYFDSGYIIILLYRFNSNENINTLNLDRKSTRLNSSHIPLSRMPSSA